MPFSLSRDALGVPDYRAMKGRIRSASLRRFTRRSQLRFRALIGLSLAKLVVTQWDSVAARADAAGQLCITPKMDLITSLCALAETPGKYDAVIISTRGDDAQNLATRLEIISFAKDLLFKKMKVRRDKIFLGDNVHLP